MKHNKSDNLFYNLKFITLRNIINTSIKHFLGQIIKKPFPILKNIPDIKLSRSYCGENVVLVGLLSDYTL